MSERSSFKDLIVWQKSLEFANEVIDLAEKMKTERRHYRLIEQLEAASTSIAMNIAEGKGRSSRKEFRHFLFIARGSLYETVTLLEMFKLRNWIELDQFAVLEEKSIMIAKMLNSLINAIKSDA
jgi:four helix bundle protein